MDIIDESFALFFTTRENVHIVSRVLGFSLIFSFRVYFEYFPITCTRSEVINFIKFN